MDSAKDRNGMTEAQFLRSYDVTKYFRPSVTVDAVLTKPDKDGGKLLMIRRGGHPFIGMWAFPGGFVEENESCEAAASRELLEETGVTGLPLRQLVTVSTPERDPRWRNITAVFYAVTDEIKAEGGDDAAEAVWFDYSVKTTGDIAELTMKGEGGQTLCSRLKVVRDAFSDIDINNTVILDRGGIAFDHAKIILYLYEKTRGEK